MPSAAACMHMHVTGRVKTNENFIECVREKIECDPVTLDRRQLVTANPDVKVSVDTPRPPGCVNLNHLETPLDFIRNSQDLLLCNATAPCPGGHATEPGIFRSRFQPAGMGYGGAS